VVAAADREPGTAVAAGTAVTTAVRRSAAGEAYLAGRGLDPSKLIACGAVRFDHGNLTVALHAQKHQRHTVRRRYL